MLTTDNRLLSSASDESAFPGYLDSVLKLLLSRDKKHKPKSEDGDEVPSSLTMELFRALLSNENILNNRPFLGKFWTRTVSERHEANWALF